MNKASYGRPDTDIIGPSNTCIPAKGITLVMPVLNGARYIGTTLHSIRWDEVPLELIVVDGGSNDGTIDIVREYQSKHSEVKLVQSAGSQVHAINLGIGMAEHQIINWLNSDDVLVPGALKAVVDSIYERTLDFAYGNSFVFDNRGDITRLLTSCQLDLELYQKCGSIFQGSLFFRKAAYLRYGPLDESLKVSFEYKLFDRFFENLHGMHIDRFIAGYRMRPDSISQKNLKLGAEEFLRFRSAEIQKMSSTRPIVRKFWRMLTSGIALRRIGSSTKLFFIRFRFRRQKKVILHRYFNIHWSDLDCER